MSLFCSPLWSLGWAVVLVASMGSAPSLAAPNAPAEDGKKAKSKKKKAAKAEDAFADLFGAPAATGGDLESLKAATSGLKKSGGGAALKPKAAKIRDGANVSFPMIFASERIKLDRKTRVHPRDATHGSHQRTSVFAVARANAQVLSLPSNGLRCGTLDAHVGDVRWPPHEARRPR